MQQLDSVQDQGTQIVQLKFYDEEDVPVVPVTASWTLTDGHGELVNDLEDVTIDNLDTAVFIYTSGADNNYQESGSRLDNTRCIVVKSTYHSSLVDADLPNNKAFKYLIQDLPQT